VVEDPDMSTGAGSAREAILGRVRSALRDLPSGERPDDLAVPRDYRTGDHSDRAERVERFAERVAEYKAVVRRVSADGLPGAIAGACAARGVTRLVVPAGLPPGWAPEGVTLLSDRGLSAEQIEASDGVLTACALAIAQTGTIVLDAGPGQGRRALTLLPDYHLCVVRDDQIVGLVPEAVARLSDAARRPDRPLTFISGPSATSDIELSRVEGVHGPRALEVLVVETGP
jgi:L-lactate dehydrogenase complex protein LldG